MSRYSLVQGKIKYKDQLSFDRAKRRLELGSWIDSNGTLLDENGKKILSGEIILSQDKLEIHFPYFLYRNLNYIIKDLINGSLEAEGLWACSDGCFEAGDFNGNVVDLNQWAKKMGFGDPPDDFDDLVNWQESVIESFMG